MDSNFQLFLLKFVLELDLFLAHINLCLSEGDYQRVALIEINPETLQNFRKIQHELLKLLFFFGKYLPQNPDAYDFAPLGGKGWKRWRKVRG